MADEFRKYNSTREIIKLDLVATEDYTDNVLLCVPKFAYDVARSMLGHYGKFRTSYATDYGDQFYKLPSDVEFDTIEASIDLFLGSRDMSCDITEGLECICNQLAELTAATYTSNLDATGSGLPQQSPGVPGGTVPDGASTADPAITDRLCKAAHFIVDNYKLMLFDLFTSSPPPWYSLGETTAYIQGIGGNAGFATMLAQIYNFYATVSSAIFGATIDYEAIYDDVVANYDSLICALVTAPSATDAIEDFLAELTITGADLDLMETLLQNNIINVLWFAVADSEVRIAEWPTPTDCDACDPCDNAVYDVYYGVDTLNRTAASAPNVAVETVDVRWSTLSEGCEFTLTALGVSITLAGPTAYRLYDGVNAEIYNSNTPPTLPFAGVWRVLLVDSDGTPFNIAWTLE